MNQIACKVAPALATGCTMVLKPSEVAPLSAYVFAEIMDEAGVPAGVFNLINGDGAGVGTLLSKHKDVDLVSFTGSTRAGSLIAQNAAPTVKRVTQELGGKSPNIILPDADIQEAVVRGAMHMFHNTGQSCNAPSRMLVHRSQLAEAEAAAAQAASLVVVGNPEDETTAKKLQAQAEKIETVIKEKIAPPATSSTDSEAKQCRLKAYFVDSFSLRMLSWGMP